MASRRILTGLLALAVLVQAAAQVANETEVDVDVVLVEYHNPADFNGTLSGRRLSKDITQCMCVASFKLTIFSDVDKGVLETTNDLDVRGLKVFVGDDDDDVNHFSQQINFAPATLTTPSNAIATCKDGDKVPGTTNTLLGRPRVRYTGNCVVGDVDEKACQWKNNGWEAVAGTQSGKICQDLPRPKPCSEVCKRCPPNSHFIAASTSPKTPARCECDPTFEPDQSNEACRCPKYADLVDGKCKCRFGPAVTNPSAGPCEPGMWVRIGPEPPKARRGAEF